MSKGILIIVSGPSGSGKGTVVGRILEKRPDFVCSVSATTRAPRENEVDGVSYYFLDRAEFEGRIAKDMMLEHAEYCGNYYGTPKKEVFANLEAGRNVILEIEVQGAMQVKRRCPEAVMVMIAPPDYDTLERRLRGRGDRVAEEVIRARLEKAKFELSLTPDYDYLVINGDDAVEAAADEIIGIADSEKRRTSRNKTFYDDFFA